MNNDRRFAVFQILSLQIYMECKDPRFPFTHPFYSNWKNKILISMIKFCNMSAEELDEKQKYQALLLIYCEACTFSSFVTNSEWIH